MYPRHPPLNTPSPTLIDTSTDILLVLQQILTASIYKAEPVFCTMKGGGWAGWSGGGGGGGWWCGDYNALKCLTASIDQTLPIPDPYWPFPLTLSLPLVLFPLTISFPLLLFTLTLSLPLVLFPLTISLPLLLFTLTLSLPPATVPSDPLPPSSCCSL